MAKRKHRHYPDFHKSHAGDPVKNFHYGRRAHGIAKDVAPTPSAIAKAASRADLYKHAHARRMDKLAAHAIAEPTP